MNDIIWMLFFGFFYVLRPFSYIRHGRYLTDCLVSIVYFDPACAVYIRAVHDQPSGNNDMSSE